MITISRYGSESFSKDAVNFLLIFEHDFKYDDRNITKFRHFSMSNFLRLLIAKNKWNDSMKDFVRDQYRFDLNNSIKAMEGVEILKTMTLAGKTVQFICDSDMLFDVCTEGLSAYLRANGLAVEIRGESN